MNRLIIINNGKILLVKENDTFRLPVEGEFPLPSEDDGIFTFAGYKAFNAAFEKGEGIREAWQLLGEKDYAAVAKGAELLNWNNETRYCSCCGAKLRRHSEISKLCPSCAREVFPSLWPAIVVLVLKDSATGDRCDEEALLVHARTLSRPTVLTLVAGFVETGESLEECVAREVREETSLEVDDIRYVGSQSWPFPHQLMFGFTARYKSGELRFADGELTAGGFFRRDSLPDLPTLPSLSRRIIDAWAAGELKAANPDGDK